MHRIGHRRHSFIMTRNRNNNGGTHRPNSGQSITISQGVTSEWIKSFYQNYDCSKHRAACAACQKREPFDGDEFSSCAGCQVSVYCSRECQKAHWKDHKEFCQANRCTEENSHFKKALRNMKKFQGLYYPLIELMIHLRLALLAKELDLDLDTIQNTHTINLILSDIPEEMTDAKKPRIMVRHLETKAFADLLETDRLSFEETRGEIMDQGEKCSEDIWLTEGINGMAKGTRPDIYKEVKRFLKEDGGRHSTNEDDSSESGSVRSNRKKNRTEGRDRGTLKHSILKS
ncbi:hypothetical protein QTG54_000638 [Skeletonema marinoi]|uniref:MYND-type domain-containing protein n=1 Tax=Skeletonema marinoi TaxID=267567 RepID=A0AAD8YNG7_9STRA|nr:hypothetical protein QTG54_000638 [Skeletonema marinoi]